MNWPEELVRNVQPQNFDEIALEVFRFQASFNPVYRDYLSFLKIAPSGVKEVKNIPFLPIEVFKKHRVVTGDWQPQAVFTSSGTTGQQTSSHYLFSEKWYEGVFRKCLQPYFPKMEEYTVFALMPSYLERKGSSLVFMVERIIENSLFKESGFYLHNHADLYNALCECKRLNRKCLLIGVTFGLLDFTDLFQLDFPELIVMETGGMKGRREEWTRAKVHSQLKSAFGVSSIWSEYGMTELMSQAYAPSEGFFEASPTLKVLLREVQDPLSIHSTPGFSGGINVIDLGNIHTCSFIATGDLGRLHAEGRFEVLGRYDHADTRGCNLMVV